MSIGVMVRGNVMFQLGSPWFRVFRLQCFVVVGQSIKQDINDLRYNVGYYEHGIGEKL